MIRRWIPKGSPIEEYSTDFIAEKQNWINDYTRPVLGKRMTARKVFMTHLSDIPGALELYTMNNSVHISASTECRANK